MGQLELTNTNYMTTSELVIIPFLLYMLLCVTD